MNIPIEPEDTMKAGVSLVKQIPKIHEAWRDLRRRLNEGNTVVAVLGAGGVGKTTLGKMLDDSLSSVPVNYEESTDIDTFWMSKKPHQSVVVAPGQEQRQKRYWGEIYRRLALAKKNAVVVHIVANGYHSFGVGFSLAGGDNALQDYLVRERKRELKVLEDIVSYLSNTPLTNLKMLTMVNKEDLWWNQKSDVMQYYEQGDYAEQIRKLTDAVGTQRFSHEYAYAALCVHNLRTESGEIVVKTVEGYDDVLRYAGQERVAKIIERLAQ